MYYLPFAVVLAISSSALAHANDNGMDMSMDGPMSLAVGNMFPYLHFTPGDNLWFLGWVPRSAGAMVGACVGLFLLALVERWIAACRAVMEVHWSRRAQILLSNELNTAQLPSESKEKKSTRSLLTVRFAPPFLLTHDVPRGILHAGQSALGIAFMLAVMTFQAGFVLAIVVGLGVGEAIFGRYTNPAAHLS